MINRFTKSVDNALEQYVPLPFDTMFKAGQATQQRYDQSVIDDTATQTGLASIEARSPAYKQYVDKAISGYRESMTGLIKQYNGRLDDPEFKRQAKQVQNQYANDPAFQTIKLGNEAIKQTQGIEAQLKAQGKLYISDLPNFKGVDENGKLAVYNGSPQAVNTLDDWTKTGAIAHGSTEDIGNVTTNKRNLSKWRQSLQSDVAGQTKLMQAYQQQGMSPQQAAAAVKSSIQGLVNQYGVETKYNTGLMGLQQSASQFAISRQDRLNDQAADRANKLAIAKLKAAGKGPNTDANGNALPSVRTDNLGFTTGEAGKSSQFVPTFGSSTLNIPAPVGSGLQNFPGGFYRQTNDNKNESYDGNLKRQTGSAKMSNGQFEGLHNVAVNSKGDVITSSNKGEFIDRGGKSYYRFRDTKGTFREIEAKPQTMKVYTDKGTGSVYYAPANAQESMRYMGASGAYWEGRKTIAEQFGYKGDAAVPAGLQNLVKSFDFSNPNVANTVISVGSSRGYSTDLIDNVFKKAASGSKLNRSEASVLDNILSDITNQVEYNKFNKGEFDNQGKRSNIYNGVTKGSNDNTFSQKDVSDAVNNYLEEQDD